MKRIILAALALCLCVALIGCGEQTADTGATTVTEAATSTAAGKESVVTPSETTETQPTDPSVSEIEKKTTGATTTASAKTTAPVKTNAPSKTVTAPKTTAGTEKSGTKPTLPNVTIDPTGNGVVLPPVYF